MTNIILFPLKNKPLLQQSLDRAIRYAAMPAWVTGCAPLNRIITDLQTKGWMIEARPGVEIICTHPKIQNISPITLIEAQEMQKILERKTS
jgi:hypothetical protein